MDTSIENLNGENRHSQVDTRTLFVFSIFILGMLMFSRNVNQLLYLALISVFFSIIFTGISSTLRTIWSMKYFLIMVMIFTWLLTSNFNSELIIETTLTVIILITAFSSFSKLSNPDLIVDALIKLRIPPTFAWKIGLSLRQVYFIQSELTSVRAIHRNRYLGDSSISNIKNIVRSVVMLISNSISRAIIKAEEISDSLYIRGYQGAHAQIMLQSTNFTLTDYILFIILVILVIPFLILRSQLFI